MIKIKLFRKLDSVSYGGYDESSIYVPHSEEGWEEVTEEELADLRLALDMARFEGKGYNLQIVVKEDLNGLYIKDLKTKYQAKIEKRKQENLLLQKKRQEAAEKAAKKREQQKAKKEQELFEKLKAKFEEESK